MWKRVFAILHLCPDPKLAFLRFYTYVRTANKIEKRVFAILHLCPDPKLAFLRFYTYVRTKNSRFYDFTFLYAHGRGIRTLGCDLDAHQFP